MSYSGFNSFNKDDDEKKNVIKEVDAEGNETGKVVLPIDKQLATDWTEEFNNFNNGGGEPVITPSEGIPETGGAGNGSGTVTDTGTGTSDLQQKSLLDTQIAEVWNQIANRQPFSYDMNGDALYQQYADIYQNNANLAMQNAMAQSAALTGGYGNSYAQAAGQQAYAQQMQNLNDVGMELYDRAYGEYQAEGQELYNQLATLYGFSQDKEAIDQWHAINGDFEYDDKGNIIGLKGGEAEEQQKAAEEAANPYTTYVGTSDYVGEKAEVPKQLANVDGLTTVNTDFFNGNGQFMNAAIVRTTTNDDGKVEVTYNLGGKEITVRKGYSPYTNTRNPDVANGSFKGYQPNNVGGAPLTETNWTYVVNGQEVPAYAKEGDEDNYYVYDAANNRYLEIPRSVWEGEKKKEPETVETNRPAGGTAGGGGAKPYERFFTNVSLR
jgi:hypothetical protein